MNERVEARWVYIGRRVIKRNATPAYGWVLESEMDRQFYFSKLKGHAVGGVYTVTVTPGDDGGVTAHGDPKYTGEQYGGYDAREQVAAWQALDQSVRRADQMRKAEARAARSPELELALQPLRNMLRTARTYGDAEAMLTVVRRQLMREYGEGKLR